MQNPKRKKRNPNTSSPFVIIGVDSHMIFCVDSHLSAPSSIDLAMTEALLLLRYNTVPFYLDIVIGLNGMHPDYPLLLHGSSPPNIGVVLVCGLDKLGE